MLLHVRKYYGTTHMKLKFASIGTAHYISIILNICIVGVDHAMADVVKGGAFAVVAMDNSTATDHPTRTCVAPESSESVVCGQ